MIKLLLRAWELIAWIHAFQHSISVTFAHLLGRPLPTLPDQLSSTSKPVSIDNSLLCDSTKLAFVDLLEINSDLILTELEQLDISRFVSWGDQYPHQAGWCTFSFYAYGLKFENNCQSCLETSRLLEQVPNLVTAGFAALAPGTCLTYPGETSRNLWRCHLGLLIPEQCGIQIQQIQQTWRKGKCLIFDHAADHTVWNWSNRTHVILSIDFRVPKERLMYGI